LQVLVGLDLLHFDLGVAVVHIANPQSGQIEQLALLIGRQGIRFDPRIVEHQVILERASLEIIAALVGMALSPRFRVCILRVSLRFIPESVSSVALLREDSFTPRGRHFPLPTRATSYHVGALYADRLTLVVARLLVALCCPDLLQLPRPP
jgi:hypothetical protein